MPNIAIIQELRDRNSDLEFLYIGEKDSLEQKLMKRLGVPFKPILCGKLRRYFSLKNFSDLFKIPIGIWQSLFAILKFKPTAIFCKGGYVSFPVAFAGWMTRVPVYLHESDVVPGLANRISSKFADTICVSFEEGKKFFPPHKVVYTGNPVRRELNHGDKKRGKKYAGFNQDIPVLFFMGGSQGADYINKVVWNNINSLLSKYNVVHICGEGKVKNPEEILKMLGNDTYLASYRAFAFVDKELRDLYTLSDVIISRAGANTLSEIKYFNKPSILIPLSKKVSRGDQLKNAEVFAREHKVVVMNEENFENEEFIKNIEELVALRDNQPPNERKHTAASNIIKLFENENWC